MYTYVINRGQGAVWSPHFAVGIAKALKRLLSSLLAVTSQGVCSGGSLTGDVTS
jgi:hypothetical protein